MRNRFLVSFLAVSMLWVASASAQTAGLALSTSVGYNTQRLSLKLSPEQAKEAARLGEEATKATRAGKFGDALGDYAQGQAVMHGVAWTPDVEYASALRGKLDHAMVDQSKMKAREVTVSIAPLYATEHTAAAKLSASVVLVQGGKDAAELSPKAALNPAPAPFIKQVELPLDAAGDYTVEVRLTAADGAAPDGVRNAFVKSLPIHVEDLSSSATRLRITLARNQKAHYALPSAEYVLALYERADKGEVNPRTYDFRKEFATAQAIVDAVYDGSDPFAGKKGDFRRAYRSTVDQTLQPYRLFVPAAYDGAKPLPLMVALHGMGGDENSMFDQYGKELPVDADKAGFIVVAPKGRDPASMYRGSAEQDVLDVMNEVQRDYRVDRTRIFLMGHSMGGFGTWSIAQDHPGLFAALGPISGGGSAEGMVKLRNIPQYVTHGDDDRTVSVNSSRTMVEAGKKAGASITYVEVPGGSHVSVAQPAFAPMIEFFKKQQKQALAPSTF
jgi:predicted esterase